MNRGVAARVVYTANTTVNSGLINPVVRITDPLDKTDTLELLLDIGAFPNTSVLAREL